MQKQYGFEHGGQTTQITREGYRSCPACEYCTRERFPDRCTCFRQCVKYRCWLKKTWQAVVAPFVGVPARGARGGVGG